jgi:hypothetical protein
VRHASAGLIIEVDCAFPKDYQKDECVRAVAVSQPPIVERNGRSGNGWTLLKPADFPIYGTDSFLHEQCRW